MREPVEDIIDLKGLIPSEIDRLCRERLRQKPGQGLRVAIWLYRKKVGDFDFMADLNRPFREQLKKYCTLSGLTIEQRSTSEDGTEKLLYRLDDGNTIEGVLIPGPGRLTLCASTQVGCASGCSFCRTGSSGLVRNLTSAEIVNQVLAVHRIATVPITNIVLMGTGEPLSNYDTVKSFVQIATDRNGMGFPKKKVTISTCGLAPMIERMSADEDMTASLAVSLNATTNDLRDRIMPVNRIYPIGRLMQALHYYCRTTGNTVTIEYVMFKGLNDSFDDAKRLTVLLKGLPCMINLLMFNPFPGSSFVRPDEKQVYAFRDFLLNHDCITVVRNSRGMDIGAACGQLRATNSVAANQSKPKKQNPPHA
jgi:23S rRNA (adenine2503-C2)-methyltransferase